MAGKPSIVSSTPDGAESAMSAARQDGQPELKPMKASYKPKRASAGSCPACKSDSTRIYRTDRATRYCVCDGCGTTWKNAGIPADELSQYAVRIAESLDQAVRIESNEGPVVAMSDEDARNLAAELRRLAYS